MTQAVREKLANYERGYSVKLIRHKTRCVYSEIEDLTTTRNNVVRFCNQIRGGKDRDLIRLQISYPIGYQVITSKWTSFVVLKEFMIEILRDVRTYDVSKLHRMNRKELVEILFTTLPLIDGMIELRKLGER
jgi:hypothetical protein